MAEHGRGDGDAWQAVVVWMRHFEIAWQRQRQLRDELAHAHTADIMQSLLVPSDCPLCGGPTTPTPPTYAANFADAAVYGMLPCRAAKTRSDVLAILDMHERDCLTTNDDDDDDDDDAADDAATPPKPDPSPN